MNKMIKLFLVTAMILGMGSMTIAETTWRMATKQPVDSPEGLVFQRFADLTDEYTGGELKIQVFPNEQLGKEDAVLEQLQAGIVNIYAEGFGYMRKWAPELSWVSPAFMFD
ncbi:MAG: C4-dicarboxylate ABC transporter substrate-binding protein, partial [Sphingomonadales bacterium]|nr:C4-dicarboxylate ABC transporter substrate-binding protein [Sphingomonadales bacterium]